MSIQSHDARRFADYFAICGLDAQCGLEPDLLSGDQLNLEPLLRPYRGRVLHHYPDNVPWNPFDKDAVHMLCFPKGLSFSTSRRQREERFHPFLITRADGSRIYGAAYTFYEKVHDQGICDAMAMLQQMHSAELGNVHPVTFGSGSLKRPLKREDSIAYYNPSSDELYVTKCICIIMQKPFLRAAEQWLTQLHATAMRHSDTSQDGASPLPLESHVYNLLYEVPLPPLGRSVSFAAGRRKIVSQRPGSSELPLLDLPFEEVFQLLGIENTIRVLTCMLLEQRVLLRSADYYRLVLVAECLTHMMFPFAWQHVYVPILPASLEHYLDAPVPYIMGLCHRPDQNLCSDTLLHSDVCTVDIDKKDVLVPEDTPDFPYSCELNVELAMLFKQHSAPLNSGDSKNNLLLASGAFEEDDGSVSPDGSCSDDSDVPATNGGSTVSTKSKPKTGNIVVSGGSSGSSSSGLDSRLEALQDNETLARVAKIVSGARVYCGSLKDVEKQLAHEGRCIEEQRLWEIKERSRLKLSNALREVIFNRLLQLLVSYEKFIIQPSPDTTMEQWLCSRETMLNFDTKAFLCDQPDVYLQFLCPFLETQMFATLIDNKIMSQWEEPDLSVSLLDKRLATLHSKAAAEADSGVGGQQPGHAYIKASYEETEALIESRAARIDFVAPAPHPFDGNKKNDATASSGSVSLQAASGATVPACNDGFPALRPELLVCQHATGSETSAFSRASPAYETLKWRRVDGQILPLEQAKLNAEQRRSLTRRSSRIYDTNPVVIEETNSKFVAGLLKEVKFKTNRMVVNKMGHEAAALGHNSLIGLEENALIGGLCELLERIWTHGLQHKQAGRAPLWAHLTSFGELSEMAERNKHVMTFQTPPPAAAPASPGGSGPLPDLQQLFHDIADARGSKDRGHRRKGSTGSSERLRPHLEPLPDNLLCDFRYVQKMKEVKTGVGKTRAWIRLCLEKKVLEKRLRELLSEADLCSSLYKRYAFLRCEEDRDQALCHLLSLNAADFFCFTNTFTSTVMTYRLLVFPSKRFAGGLSTTTANAWISLAGHLRESDKLSIPKGTFEVVYEGQNLGVLSTVRIGHDNSGLSPKWLVDFVLVRNDTTGHVYKFTCGRWLGKGVDDGSTERILVGELLSSEGLSDGALEAGQSSPRRTDSPKLTRQHSDKRRLTDKVDVERSLIDAVNGLVKYYCRPEKERGSVTVLLCGDGGLVASLEAAFQCGFKSARFLRNNYYLWDYIERVQSTLADEGCSPDGPAQIFCDTVTTINNSAQSIGKDGKFQLLMCLAIRDHCLPQWLALFHSSSATAQMYEESAFLRDESAVRAVAGALSSVRDFNICLEPSLTKGLQTSPSQQRS